MPDLSLLMAAALDCAARGWHVFPLRPDHPHAAEDEAKRPAFPNRCTADRCDRTDPRCRAAGRHVGWEERATTDPTRIRRAWSARPYGVGIACGPSGLLVVDLDVPKHPDDTPPPQWAGLFGGMDVFAVLAEQHGTPTSWIPGYGPDGPATGIDATYTVTTGREGRHLYYRHPDTGPVLGNTTGERGGIGWKIDTKSHGGYVVAAGCTVNGRPYTLTFDREPAPLPGWLAELLTPAARPAYRPAAVALPPDRRGRYVAAAIRNQVAHLAAAPDGERNNVLFASAVALGQLIPVTTLTDDDVYTALTPAALSAGLTAGEVARTIASGLRIGQQEPRRLSTAGRAA